MSRQRFISLSCLTLDEEDVRRLASKKLGLPADAPLEEILEKGKHLFVPLVEPN